MQKYFYKFLPLGIRDATAAARKAQMGMSSQTGFTLIELLVVIAIIGLLASIVLASLTSARAKARDAKRLGDLRSLQTAVELYSTEHNGQYPTTNGAWWGNCPGFGSHGTSGANGWIPNLSPQYVGVLPLDPKPIGNGNCYLYRSNATDYMLLAYGTVETYPSGKSPRPRPGNINERDFAFYSNGARLW